MAQLGEIEIAKSWLDAYTRSRLRLRPTHLPPASTMGRGSPAHYRYRTASRRVGLLSPRTPCTPARRCPSPRTPLFGGAAPAVPGAAPSGALPSPPPLVAAPAALALAPASATPRQNRPHSAAPAALPGAGQGAAPGPLRGTPVRRFVRPLSSWGRFSAEGVVMDDLCRFCEAGLTALGRPVSKCPFTPW